MERRRGPKALKLALILAALGAGGWFGRGYLPEAVRAPVESIGARVQELVQEDDPSQLRVGQRFVYGTGAPGRERRVEITRLDGETVHLQPSLSQGGQATPDTPAHQSWTDAKTRGFLRGMGLGPMREDTITIQGVPFVCQVYENPKVPFRVWLCERFPGVIRLERKGQLMYELERIEQVVSSERVEWAEPRATWTLWF
jgi:hypothetical protein